MDEGSNIAQIWGLNRYGAKKRKDDSRISSLGNWKDLFMVLTGTRGLREMIMNLVVRKNIGKFGFTHD